jgi:hypothetical protein
MAFELILGRVVAIFMIVTGVAIAINRKEFASLAKELKKSNISRILGGMMDMVVGLFIVIGHNVWTNDWRVIITIIGWLAILEGSILLFMPHKSLKFVQLWRNPATTYVSALLSIVVGVYLAIQTFF